jgi:hypothetical protein
MLNHEVKDFESLEENVKSYCSEEGVQIAHCRKTRPNPDYYTVDSFNVTLTGRGLDCFVDEYRGVVDQKAKEL